MTGAASLPKVESAVQYAAQPKERLWFKANERTSNIEYVDTNVTIFDARPLIGKTSIDQEGFEVLRLTSHVRNWDDEEEVKMVYFQEACDLVKRATAAKHVMVFDHTFRRVGGSEPSQKNGGSRPPARGAAKGVHSDFSAESAGKRMNDVLGPGMSNQVGRFAIVNLWKPLVDVVYDVPLGVMDATSVAVEDLTPYDLIFPDRVGQTLAVHANPKHRWFWLPRQRENEVYLFKQFDSDDTKTRFTPHSPCQDPNVPPAGTYKPRESIELRIFVFYDKGQSDVSLMQHLVTGR